MSTLTDNTNWRKVEALQEAAKRVRTGGKGSRRRIPPRKRDPSRHFVNSLEQLLTKNKAVPVNGVTTMNFLVNHEDQKTKTIYTFKMPRVKLIQNAHMMVIFDADLETETNSDETDTNPPPQIPPRNANRHERRMKEALLKMNPKMTSMSQYPLYYQGYLEMPQQRWNIEQPQVYRYTKTTYVVFGPMSMGVQQQKQGLAAAAQHMGTDAGLTLDNFQNMNFEAAAQDDDDDDDAPDLVAQEDGKSKFTTEDNKIAVTPSGEVTFDPKQTGLSETDIHLVMSQVDATKEQVVAALQKTGGDIVNAIMELS